MFSKGFGKGYQWDWWKCTWEVRWKAEMLFWPYEMVGKENGSSLPISLQTKWFTKKVFNKDLEMSYSREEPPLAPCRPSLVPDPCYYQICITFTSL